MPENAFWTFSLDLYGRAEVASACLTLQDQGGADVNLVLYLLWCAMTDRLLDAAAIRALDARIGPWRSAVIEPLREVRRSLKKGPVSHFGSDAFRARIKGVELEAEQLVQEALFREAPLPGEPLDRVAAARDYLSLYACYRGRPLPEGPKEALLTTLARL